MEIKGKVLEVSDTIEIKEGFKKRELIVEYAENPQYPEFIKFEAIQERCDLLDPFKPGDAVEVFFNLRGRAWTDKTGKKSYFNSLQLWRIQPLVASQATPASDPASRVTASSGETKAPQGFDADQDDDDLPF